MDALTAIVVATLLGSELLASIVARDRRHEPRDTVVNLVMAGGNAVAAWLAWTPLALVAFELAYAASPLRMPAAWYSWLLLFVLEDLCHYVAHRSEHRVGLLWASHIVHHSSDKLNLSVALRTSWTGGLFLWIFWVPLAALGFHPLMILTVKAASTLWQFWVHTPYVNRLGPLGWLLVTPSHHRVHHARRADAKNFGGVLILWDRLFGTFEPERGPLAYGVDWPYDGTSNPLRIAFGQWWLMLRALWRSA